MAFDITVSQHHVRRGPNNTVLGTLQINVKNPDLGQHNQDFDYTGEQALAEISKWGVKVNAKLKEIDGKSCVTGNWSVEEPIKLGGDFDQNCEPIAAG